MASRVTNAIIPIASVISSISPFVNSAPTCWWSGASSLSGPRMIIKLSSALGLPLMTANIGTDSSVEMKLLLDTGSAVTWACSSLSNDGAFCQNGASFQAIWPLKKPSSATSWASWFSSKPATTETEGPTQCRYGRNELECTDVKTNIAFKEADLKSHSICAVTSVTRMDVNAFDGIIGLDFIGDKFHTNFIATELAKTYPRQQIMSFWSNKKVNTLYDSLDVEIRSKKTSTPNAGEMALGSPDDSKFVAPVAWMDVIECHFGWALQLKEVRGDGKKLDEGALFGTVIDTGAPFLSLNEDMFYEFTDQLKLTMDKEVGKYTFPCEEVTKLEKISLEFNGFTIDVPAKDQYKKVNGKCYLLIDNFGAYAIIGQSVLRNYYVSFDFRNKKIGFANLKK